MRITAITEYFLENFVGLGVLKEKTLYGRKSIGIERSTFIFDEDGKQIKEFRKVRVANHMEELLSYLREN